MNNKAGTHSSALSERQLAELTSRIKAWGVELGFQQLGISDTHLGRHEERLQSWLQEGHHGSMSYMERHGTRRSRPAELVPGTVRVISVRMDYMNADAKPITEVMDDPESAWVSRNALGRDYHKVMRKRLQKLASRITEETGPF